MDVLRSILHLILGSARMAVSWMGTTFLAVAVLATPFVARLILAYRAERWTGVKKAIRSASKYTVLIWAILFIIGMGRFVYEDHSRLVAENKKLRMAATNTNTATVSQYAFSPNNEYASISNTMQAFAILVNPISGPDSRSACQVKVTAPNENMWIGKMLSAMAARAGCNVIYPNNPDLLPDEAAEAGRGAVPNYIVVHASKDNPKAEAFTTMLSNVFGIKRAYTLPAKSPQNLVWLQLGTGSFWRKD
jgi:hypothetical protein